MAMKPPSGNKSTSQNPVDFFKGKPSGKGGMNVAGMLSGGPMREKIMPGKKK